MAETVAYKYSSLRGGAAILENLELKITPPNQFNDPFEFSPHIFSSNPRRYAKSLMKSKLAIRSWHTHAQAAGTFSGSHRQFKKVLKSRRTALVDQVAAIVPPAHAFTQNRVVDAFSEVQGVLCLSQRRDSILMWGHYCDSHKGLVIGFRASHELFRDLRPLQYVTERPRVDSALFPRNLKTCGYEMVFHKNKDWEYEQELRKVFVLAKLMKKPLDKSTVGYFLRMPPDCIANVIFGARCPDDQVHSVRAVLKRSHFAHVRVERASLHSGRYALEFTTLP